MVGGAPNEGVFPLKLPWLMVPYGLPPCSIWIELVVGSVAHDPVYARRRLERVQTATGGGRGHHRRRPWFPCCAPLSFLFMYIGRAHELGWSRDMFFAQTHDDVDT